jgi:hypothetical protein
MSDVSLVVLGHDKMGASQALATGSGVSAPPTIPVRRSFFFFSKYIKQVRYKGIQKIIISETGT